ncbi:MAG: dihydropteroate synthase [Bacteroidia bacterium]
MTTIPSFLAASPYSLNCRGKLLPLNKPVIMGILNLTPDSFSDGGKYNQYDTALFHTESMLQEGAAIIDIGGYSTRPYAQEISEEEELQRVARITEAILVRFPEAIVSIDSFRPGVVKPLLEMGVHIVNDVYAGRFSEEMMPLVARYGDVPYIMMHMQGTPQTMQHDPQYESVVPEVLKFFVNRIAAAQMAGIKDVIADPGFGFGKTIRHNYQLLEGVNQLAGLGVPLLAGISRKSMIYKFFQTSPEDVIEIATALHLKLLEKGVHILRVHDIKAARRITELFVYQKTHGII